jgi:hypothetical protein
VRLIARSELARRRSILLLLALLVAASTAVTLAGFAGARRADSVLHRFLTTTHARDAGAMVASADLIRQPDHGLALRDAIARLGGVRDVAVVRGFPLQAGTKYDFSIASSPDGRYFTRVDAPILLHGRMPRASSATEVALSDSGARELGLGPGDTLSGTVYDPETVAGFIAPAEAAPTHVVGHRIALKVVGVVRTQDELQGQQNGSNPMAIASPAFDRAHRSDIGSSFSVYAVRGPARTKDLWAVMNALPGAGRTSFAQVATLDEDFGGDAGTAYRAIAAATLAFSVVVLLATILTVAIATGRQISMAAEADRLGWELGLSRRERVVALVAPPGVALMGGLLLGVVGALAASPLFPLSTARLAEPDPGVRFDPLVHLGGVVVLAVVFGIVAITVASRSLDRRSTGVAARRARWIPTVADGHVPAMVGIRQAFGRGGDRRSIPSFGARVGAVVSVAGVVAVAVLMASIHVARTEPARFGWTWDSHPDLNDNGDVAHVRSGLIADRDVAGAAEILGDVAEVDQTPMSLRAIRDIKGSTPLSITRGRMPDASDEVVLGRIAMRDLGVDVGREVSVKGKDGEARSMTVVGEVVLPPVDSNGDVGTGFAVTADTFQRLVGDGSSQNLVLTYRRGSDHAAVERRLKALGLAFPVYARPEPPGLILQLNRMGSVATALMVFLAALGSVGLLHFLAASVRGRRAEFGCLRALGLVRRQVLGAVTWQAVAISCVGLVVGVPGGIILGRSAWRLAIGGLGMVDDPAVPVWIIVAVTAIVVVGTVVLAAGPGWLASRRAPAALLRSE